MTRSGPRGNNQATEPIGMTADRRGQQVVGLPRQRDRDVRRQHLGAGCVRERTWTSIPAASMPTIRVVEQFDSAGSQTKPSLAELTRPPRPLAARGRRLQAGRREMLLDRDYPHAPSPLSGFFERVSHHPVGPGPWDSLARRHTIRTRNSFHCTRGGGSVIARSHIRRLAVASLGAVSLLIGGPGLEVRAGDVQIPETHQHVNGVEGVLTSSADGSIDGSGLRNVGGLICSAGSSGANADTTCEGVSPSNETSIAVNPTNSQNVVGSANDY
jgi:hypothetical protein